jgi:hypothetical protein
MRYFLLFSLCLTTLFLQAQPITPEEAAAKLAEKDSQRQLERGQLVQITAGELADLRIRIKQLEGEVSALQGRVGDKERDTAKKIHTSIEIGMTKAEVLAFVKRSTTYKVVGQSADAGVHKSSEQVSVKRDSSVKKDVAVAKNNDDATTTHTKTDIAGTSKTQIDVVRSTGVRETLQLAKYSTYQRLIGTRRRGLGLGGEDEYETVSKVDGTISVVFIDGIVSAVNAN